ncbi:DNA polymerase I (EC 2.7.7.7) [Azospirillum argentinense]|uniref:DNA polymerase n=1 Tax=Azospirillum argentinense TaxID=2970906 RepID=UPI0032DF46EC
MGLINRVGGHPFARITTAPAVAQEVQAAGAAATAIAAAAQQPTAAATAPVPANESWVRPSSGRDDAPILVVCAPPDAAADAKGLPMATSAMAALGKAFGEVGITRGEIRYVGLCPALPGTATTESRKTAFVAPYADGLRELIETSGARVVVPLGKLALTALEGRKKPAGRKKADATTEAAEIEQKISVSKARGVAIPRFGRLMFPMLDPTSLRIVPQNRPMFDADAAALARIKANDWRAPDVLGGLRYEWRDDLSDLLANPPKVLAVDTETTGLRWQDASTRVITVQLTPRPGFSFVVPVDMAYRREQMPKSTVGVTGDEEWDSEEARDRVVEQLRALLENPAIKKVGQNFKFDHHQIRASLGIEVRGWLHDALLLTFFVDENMKTKNLDDITKRWVPALAGYADEFNRTIDKGNMLAVEPDKMLLYAGGDTDATFRAVQALVPLAKSDDAQYHCYRRVAFPALLAFTGVEKTGMLIDTDALDRLGRDIRAWLEVEYDALIAMVPPAIRRRRLEAKQSVQFSAPEFVREILFTPAGFGLKPVVFTDSTAELEDEDERVASTSAKDHLPYFMDDPVAGEFVTRLAEFKKTAHVLSSFVGIREDGNGLWQHLTAHSKIHPTYFLHTTDTGRTSSRNPNGQNFPKRGTWAKRIQSCFVATPGWRLVAADLSQAELRIAAWMAHERRMLEIYRQDGDIHAATAMVTAGLTEQMWAALSKERKKELRTKAKAINFGFLYGMSARMFREYAFTQYGVRYTEEEARDARKRFFAFYRDLPAWHDRMRDMAHQNGYVRALHGALRRVPHVFADEKGIVAQAERQAINSPVQRFGSDLGVMALGRLAVQADPDVIRPIGYVHDALYLEAREGHELDAVQTLVWVMETLPLDRWFGIQAPIPIRSDPDVGMDLGHMVELREFPDEAKLPQFLRDDPALASSLRNWQPRKPDWWSDAKDHEFYASFGL